MLSLLHSLGVGFASFFLNQAQTAVRLAALQQQLAAYRHNGTRPRIGLLDRLFWIALCRYWSGWKQSLVFVQPDTVIRWHHKGFRIFWTWKSRTGRPHTNQELIDLITRISIQNPGWGAARINAELRKLGHFVSTETVRKYTIKTRPLPVGPRRPSQSWRTFLKNHGKAILACDFLVQHTAGFGQFYIFVVLEVGSRKVLRAQVTRNPSLDWVKNQLREVFAWQHSYRFLIHDNDAIFGQFGPRTRKLSGFRCHLDRWLRGVMLIRGIPTPYHAPNANAYVERFNRAIREEALNHFIFFGERHLQQVVDDYVDYYNHARPSQGTGEIPEPRAGPPMSGPPDNDNIVAHPILGGLHHDYRRAA